MLTRVVVTNRQGALLDLPLGDSSGGIFVDTIEGLDPVQATLVSSSFAQMDGAQYHSSRRESRNIKIKLGFEPDFITMTVEDLRRRLYSFFMPKTEVMLRFYVSDLLHVDIVGRIESFDMPLFAEEPEADISIMCFDPDFNDPNLVQKSGMSVSGLTETLYAYPGTVETGLRFTLRPDRDISAFTIYHRPPDGTLRIVDFSAPLLDKDVLRISSVPGSKSVIRTRSGVDVSHLYAVSPQSSWLEFLPGDNYLRVYVEGLPIPFDIEYITKYGGL